MSVTIITRLAVGYRVVINDGSNVFRLSVTQLEAAAAMVQRNLAAVNEPAGQVAVSHGPEDSLPAPAPKVRIICL